VALYMILQQSTMNCETEWVIWLNAGIPGTESIQTGPLSCHTVLWCWHSRTLTLSPTQSATVEPSNPPRPMYHHQEKVFCHADEGCCVAQQRLSPCGTHCPGHAAVHVLKDIGQSPITSMQQSLLRSC
jgi:hypothetical protein